MFAKKGRWNEVLKGRIEGLHLLASPTNWLRGKRWENSLAIVRWFG